MFRLTKFKLHVDLQLKLVFLQFDLNLFCSSFICFIYFDIPSIFSCCKNKCRNCMKRTRSSLTDLQRSRDWEAHHRSSQVLFVLFVVLCVLNFLFNYLVVSGDCLPAWCMRKGPKIHVTFCCVCDLCQTSCGNLLFLLKETTKIQHSKFCS